MNDIFNSPSIRALRSLNDSPTMRALRAIERSPSMRMFRQMQNSPAFRMIQQLESSPSLRTLRELENSSVMRMLRDLGDSPSLKAMNELQQSSAFEAIRKIRESPAIQAIQRLDQRPYLRAFSTIAERISHGYGALEFSEAYEFLAAEYAEHAEAYESDPGDMLGKSVRERAKNAPRHSLSADFYLSVILTLLIFLLSQVSSEQSEQLLIKRMDAMEQTISMQLETIRNNPSQNTYMVADRTVNLRSAPGTNGTIVGTITRSQRVKRIDESGEWVEVEYFDHSSNEIKSGWVIYRYFIVLTGLNGDDGSNQSMQRTPLTGRR